MKLRIAIGSDHAGFELKQNIADSLRQRDDLEVTDLGPDSAARCDYPDYAAAVAREIKSGTADRGILVCGSGIGVSIMANRFEGIRAAVAHNATVARLSREHNNANVLCLGSRLVGDVIALESVDAFILGEFQGGRHQGRLDKIDAMEIN